MKNRICTKLQLPDEIEKYFIGTFYDISVDDGGKNVIEVLDEETEEHMISAGLIRDICEGEYPKKIVRHMVLSDEKALNLDNLAASYAATQQYVDCMRQNCMLSTVDALYVDAKKECYFIEFKNGEWTENDISKKVYESKTLLKNLQLMDVEAVITDNRTTDKKKVDNLYISERIANYSGIDGTDEFYKKKVYLVVVYNEGKKVAEEYAKFCSKRENYEWMDQKLSEMEIKWLPKEVFDKDKINFSYEHINRLANLILTHDSANQNMEKYKAIEKMLDRISDIEKRSKSNKIIDRLNKYPEFLKYIFDNMYSNDADKKFMDTKYQNIINAENLLKFASKKSAEQILLRESRRGKDDYECICELMEEWNDKDKEKFEADTQFLREWKDCRLLKMLPKLSEIYASNFTDIGTLIEKGEYQEAVRRHIFIKRVLQDHHERIDDETKARLAENIYHLDKDTANELARQSGNCIGYYFAVLALLDYHSQDVSIKEEIPYDRYQYIKRQIDYLNQLFRKEDYGVFTKRINSKSYGKYGDEKRAAVSREAENIRKEILEGLDLKHMIPTEYMANLSISNNSKKISKLKTKLENAELYRVLGWKAADFDKKIMGIQRF